MAASERPAPPTALTRHVRDLVWMEPIDAYRALRGVPGAQPQLLDGLGLHPEARHAYLALSPAVTLEARGRHLTATHPGGVEVHANVLGSLRSWTDRFRFDVDEPEGFTGGWVGLVGYEALRFVEPTLPTREAATPDLWLRLHRDALVFDRRARTARLYVHDLPGEDGGVERLERFVEALGREPGFAPASAPRPEPAWTPSMDQTAFEAAVRRVVELAREGDLFQANLATRFQAPCTDDPADLFTRLAGANPSPYMALLDAGDWQVVSCSPEQLFAVEDGVLRTRPIAGTRPRGATPEEDDANEAELLSDPKERAEHTMLVDLLRNDVAKVSRPGSVRVPEFASVERYRHVMHLVSRVEGTLRPGTGFVDWLVALFPGGTITGAPKHRACLRIFDAEPVARGPYTGSAGFLSWSHNAHWNILIRTLVLRDGQATVHAGSGVVADSDPAGEWAEAGHKAQALLEAATGGDRGGGSRDRVGEVTRHGSWSPPAAPRQVPDRRVLLIDNYDSFTYNLADAVAALGAGVRVVRNDGDWRTALREHRATHVVLSPGPGRPEDAAGSLEAARELVGRLPVLGVCLGHQALALAAGAAIDVSAPVHGKTGLVRHDGGRLLGGLPSPLRVGRYHSLVVRPGSLPAPWRETAWLDDGTVMAMEHDAAAGAPAPIPATAPVPAPAPAPAPAFGLQFHPESISTDAGLEILLRFLET